MMKTVTVSIKTMSDIPNAYGLAIKKFKEDEECERDIWNATIKLRQINFQDNFRRSEYDCVFDIEDHTP